MLQSLRGREVNDETLNLRMKDGEPQGVSDQSRGVQSPENL